MITKSRVILFQYPNHTVLQHPTVHSLMYWLATVTVALAATLSTLTMNTTDQSVLLGRRESGTICFFRSNLCTLFEKMGVKNT
jgi:hypothetical protein